MPFSLSRLRPTAVVLVAVAFAACSDDDGYESPRDTAGTDRPGRRALDRRLEHRGDVDRRDRRHELRPPAGRRQSGGHVRGGGERPDRALRQYTDTDITADQAYSYQVAATNAEGTGSFSSTVIVEPGTAGEAVDTLTGSITSSITLSADTVYVLSGYVKVPAG